MVETIYVMTPGVSIHQDGGLLVLEQDHQVLKELPMTTVGNLVLGRTVQISTQVIFSLVKQGSLIQFVDYKYNVVGTLGDEHTTLSKLLWQAENFQDETFALRGAKYIVQRKVTAQLSILNRYNKTKSIPKYEFVRSTLERLLNRIKRTRTIDGLRGIEGLASKTYFPRGAPYCLRLGSFLGGNVILVLIQLTPFLVMVIHSLNVKLGPV